MTTQQPNEINKWQWHLLRNMWQESTPSWGGSGWLTMMVLWHILRGVVTIFFRKKHGRIVLDEHTLWWSVISKIKKKLEEK